MRASHSFGGPSSCGRIGALSLTRKRAMRYAHSGSTLNSGSTLEVLWKYSGRYAHSGSRGLLAVRRAAQEQ